MSPDGNVEVAKNSDSKWHQLLFSAGKHLWLSCRGNFGPHLWQGAVVSPSIPERGGAVPTGFYLSRDFLKKGELLEPNGWSILPLSPKTFSTRYLSYWTHQTLYFTSKVCILMFSCRHITWIADYRMSPVYFRKTCLLLLVDYIMCARECLEDPMQLRKCKSTRAKQISPSSSFLETVRGMCTGVPPGSC